MRKRYAALAAALVTATALVAIGVTLTRRPVEEASLPARGGHTMTVTPAASIPHYLQNDARWAAETLGDRGDRMAATGCTVTCLSMGLAAMGHHLDPGQVCVALREHGGFTSDGRVIWSKVGELTGGAVAVTLPRLSHQVIEAELTAKRPVIAKVMLAGAVPHWLLIVGKQGREYLALDPLDQRRGFVTVSSRSPGIYAIRTFRIGHPS